MIFIELSPDNQAEVAVISFLVFESLMWATIHKSGSRLRMCSASDISPAYKSAAKKCTIQQHADLHWLRQSVNNQKFNLDTGGALMSCV